MDEYLSKAIQMHPDAGCELIYNNNFEFLIAVLLSSQTTDKHVNKITPMLFNRFSDFTQIHEENYDEIYEIIRPLGLARNKTKNIIKLCLELQELGSIPSSIEKLEKLSGVGHKTACVYMMEIHKEAHIAVDTHVLRVSNRLGLSSSDNPIVVQKELEQRYSSDEYIKAHHAFLFLGRYTCKSQRPNCIDCLLKNICKYKK